VKFYNN